MPDRVVITGIGLEVPGVPEAADLLRLRREPVVRTSFQAHTKLGRKGLLYKEHSTRLALCAAQSALADAGLPISAATQIRPEDIGVVVSSSLGNLETIHKVVGEIHAGGVGSTSPLDLPNASSNVIASSLAIRFGCRSVNLALCNGSTGGIDAIYMGANVIRAGRADRMLVVGVEPDEPAARRLLDPSGATHLGDGAGALLLEAESSAAERGARIYAEVGRYSYTADNKIESTFGRASEIPPDLWLSPSEYGGGSAAMDQALAAWGGRAPERRDLCGALGELYGALGAIQAIAACAWLRDRPGGAVLATSGGGFRDGAASIWLTRGQLDERSA